MTCDTITFVLGGARSGKSRHAETLVEALPPPWTYIATAQPLDEEMRERIAAHRARRDARWSAVEAPLDLVGAVSLAEGPVLVDCLTLWLSNLMHAGKSPDADGAALEDALRRRTHPIVLVSNEVGLGIVPENALARRFRDEQGRLNQRMASLAGRVVLMVAGLPMVMK